MDVTDDIERSVILPPIGPQGLAFDFDGIDFLNTPQNKNVSKALALQVANRPPQIPRLTPNHVGSELPIGSARIAIQANRFVDVEHNRCRNCVVFPGHCKVSLPRRFLHVGCIDDRQPTTRQSFRQNVIENVKSIRSRFQTRLIVANPTTAFIRRNDFRRQKVLAGKCRFS
jgi:hypothetical protein